MDQQTIIIGAGPGGVSAALYLARFMHPVYLFDVPDEVPGRTSMASDIDNLVGQPDPLAGPELVARLRKQVERYPYVSLREEKVVRLKKSGAGFEVETAAGNRYEGGFVVVAVGLEDSMPPIEGLDPYYDQALFHCLTCDWYDRRDRQLAIITDKDRGIEAALMLKRLYAPTRVAVVPGSVMVSYSENALDRAAEAGIPVYISPVAEFVGSDGKLRSLRLLSGEEVPAEVAFTKLGHKRLDRFLDVDGIKIEREPEEGFIRVDFRTFETSVPNLFAVGPCNEGPDQIVIAGGEGALAALTIHGRIMESEALK